MWPCMKLRHIEELLQDIEAFQRPKVLLEQYVTPAHIALHMLFTMQTRYNDIDGNIIADLGSGCGTLAIGAAALNAALVVGFEIDGDALDIFGNNVEEHELTNVDAIQCDVVRSLSSTRFNKKFDTVIMNPPFGTKHNAGTDMRFLETAFNLSKGAVYSLHKTSTRPHVLKFANSHGVKGDVLAELRYNLPASYKFHRSSSVDIQVDFFRFEVASVE